MTNNPIFHVMRVQMIFRRSGIFLGKHGHRVSEIHLLDGGGLYLSPLFCPEEKEYDELWMKDGNHGAGLIFDNSSLFLNIPLFGWLW